jgi:hypothetical protein
MGNNYKLYVMLNYKNYILHLGTVFLRRSMEGQKSKIILWLG